MSSSRKNKMKRAVMSWLCVAALASAGNLTGVVPGIIPAVSASAETVDADHILDLKTLISTPDKAPAGVTVSRATGGYDNSTVYNIMEIKISEDGTYKLTGSNFVNGSYFDVKIIAAEGKKVDLICDDAYIKNDEGGCVNASGTFFVYSDTEFASYQYAVNYAVPFKAENGSELTLSGRLMVDTYSVFSSDGSFTAPVYEGAGKVNSDAFSVVSYKDGSTTLDENYFLDASDSNSYSYPSENAVISKVTSNVPNGIDYSVDKYTLGERYKCLSTDEHAFDSGYITADTQVACRTSHSADPNGDCIYCHKELNSTIELDKLADYLSGAAEVPDGVSIATPKDYDDFVELTISESGTYKLTGSNYINGAYLDVKIIIDNGADVTLNCDDAYIKNDKGEYIRSAIPKPAEIQGEFSYETDNSGHHIYNFVYPLNIKNGKLTLKGKLFMDTYDSPDGPMSAYYIEKGNLENYSDIDSVKLCTGPVFRTKYVEFDDNRGRDYFIKDAEYNAADYYDEYKCIWIYGKNPEDYEFSDSVSVVINKDHSLPEGGDSCENCGLAAYTVKFFVNGADKDFSVKVLKDHTVEKPADPEPLPTFKFAGWYTDDYKIFDFDTPITKNITLLAGFESCDATRIVVRTAPKTDYSEGDKFDPTGLVLDVLYEDGNSGDAYYYPESAYMFDFSPAKTRQLTVNDNKITITFQGASVDLPITVAERAVESFVIKTAPDKTSYTEGEKFDPTGLVLTVTFDNGVTMDVGYSENSGITFAPAQALSVDDSSVTISYRGKTAEQPITVAEKQPESIEVKASPRTSYTEGDKFDPTGLVLTASYNNGTTVDIEYSEDSGITFTPRTLSLSDKEVTITYGGKSVKLSVTVSKKKGGSSGPSAPSAPGRPDRTDKIIPTINGISMNWDDIAGSLEKMAVGSEVTIYLNGLTEVPVNLISVIDDRELKATFVVDTIKSWKLDGARIDAPAGADLTFITTLSAKYDGLRGTEGIQFNMNNTGVPTDLGLAFSAAHAGEFANLYKMADGKPVFVSCARIGQDGRVILPEVTDKGSYIAMLSSFSDLSGDFNNDGVLNAMDASAILKDTAGIEAGANSLVADVNGDGTVNKLDASAILKMIIGLR